jgi:hypothetical protein
VTIFAPENVVNINLKGLHVAYDAGVSRYENLQDKQKANYCDFFVFRKLEKHRLGSEKKTLASEPEVALHEGLMKTIAYFNELLSSVERIL